MSRLIVFLGLAIIAGCSEDSAKSLGAKAARSEVGYSVFGGDPTSRAATFMKAWVDACHLAKNDMMSASHREFVDAYVDGLKEEPGVAARKPLQKYVRETFWKSGLGCETIIKETPEWALK